MTGNIKFILILLALFPLADFQGIFGQTQLYILNLYHLNKSGELLIIALTTIYFGHTTVPSSVSNYGRASSGNVQYLFLNTEVTIETYLSGFEMYADVGGSVQISVKENFPINII